MASSRTFTDRADASIPSEDVGVNLDGFVLRLRRLRTELREGRGFPRTVSVYDAFYNRQKLGGLEGYAFERQGPGDNGATGSKYHRRITAGTYPLLTQDGTNYKTIGYATSGSHPRPGLLIGETGHRVAILLHPGNTYLSSIGCINLSRPLEGADDDMAYGESQLRVIAMINALRMELGADFPARNGRRITGAWLVVEGEPPNVESNSRAMVRSILRKDTAIERSGSSQLDSLSGHDVYALLAATMNGLVLPERASLQLFADLLRRISDLRSVRGEFGRNLWSEWATGWQTATTIADAAEQVRVRADLREIARHLQQAGVDINDTSGLSTPLVESARANEWESIRELHALGADLNLRDKRGDTALTAAAFSGSLGAVACLIAAGADRDAKIGEMVASRSAAADDLALGELEVCPSGSDAVQCAGRGLALHDGNAARRSDYQQIVRALEQVKLGRACHIWDYRNRTCKESVDVWQVGGTQSAYFFSKLQVDADGAPKAYHAKDRNPPANEGGSFDWLANLSSSDQHGTQGSNGAVGPATGFIISATSLINGRFPVNDTRRYVDASTIPYVVLPKGSFPLPAGVALKNGCVVCVVDTKTGGYTGAIFADVGRAVGEGSIRLAQRLGLTPFSSSRWPKVVGFSGGANDRRFFYLVFPQTVIPPPWPVEDIQTRADALFSEWGGAERLKAICPGLPPLNAPVTVFDETAPPASRGLEPDEDANAEVRLRGLDAPKERLPEDEPSADAPASDSSGVDRGPVPGKFEPDAQELAQARGAVDVHPEELDGPLDLPSEGEVRAALPKVSWPNSESETPCYAHLMQEGSALEPGGASFDFTVADLELLVAANSFKPEGHGDRIVFALRGCRLQQKDSFENVDTISVLEVKPDHRTFCCVIGVFNKSAGKFSAFKASTVPNVSFMTNYYKKVHGIQPYREIGANMLPTGCYVYRVGTHGAGIYPALRLTDPEKLSADGKVVVLRTSDDLIYKLDDVWDACVPYDHVHCAYSYDNFSSAGCLTVCGPNGEGPWGRFQSVLKTIPRNNRIDVVLLTGREASFASQLRKDNHAGDAALVQKRLERLRPGSQGEAVRKLQGRLGIEPSGYFGWRTKQALVEQQRRSNVNRDGIYAPKLDQLLNWEVFAPAPAAPALVASRSAQVAAVGGMPVKPTAEQMRKFAPRGLEEYLRVLVNEGVAELAAFHINDNPTRFCHFMAQIGHECGGFTIKSESLNYKTASRLRAVWPSRFPDDASARPYIGNEEKLAEKVYGGRLGNNQKGDGFRYRGRGFVQITGRGSYREMGRKLQLPLEDNPDLVLDPIVALKVACRTWADKALAGERGMNELADLNKIEALTYRINGGYTNLDDRRAEFVKAWRIWGSGDPAKDPLEPEVIERGDRGELVLKLKQDLGRLSNQAGDSDRVFGSKTYTAVCKFQQQHGLQPTGIVDKPCWDAIDSALRAKPRGLPTALPRQDRADPPPRDEALVHGVRLVSMALALLAAAFVLLFLITLDAQLASPSAWLPLVFAALVFAALTGLWAITAASDRSHGSTPMSSGTLQPPVADAATPEDPEPVRVGRARSGDVEASAEEASPAVQDSIGLGRGAT